MVRRTSRGRQVVRHGGAVAHLDAVVVVLGTALARLDVGPAIFRTFPWGVKEEEAPKKDSKWMLHCSPQAEPRIIDIHKGMPRWILKLWRI